LPVLALYSVDILQKLSSMAVSTISMLKSPIFFDSIKELGPTLLIQRISRPDIEQQGLYPITYNISTTK
jgi:hypothetical protein